MALTATVHSFAIQLSDVDRGVYETLDLRVAQHPSESTRFMLVRTLAYALSYEEGIQFSKGGISSTDEPPISVIDPTGILLAWIDVGAPSAERLHKASKAARRVDVFTHHDLATIRRVLETKAIHRADSIRVFCFAPAFLDAIEARLARKNEVEITRNDGVLYVVIDGTTVETPIAEAPLSPAAT
ncbi:MAG: YaeQ family protein [Polyangiaceae bacterium]